LIREELGDRAVAERKMFGGLCLMVNGHMMAGVHAGGAMVRVGKPNEDAAYAID
jgi:TfoX/Sxy family transcriptional regulator of competence genes